MRHPISAEAFAEWCARQNADEQYDYTDSDGCAFYQYLSANGFPVKLVGGNQWTDASGKERLLPQHIDGALITPPHTFGSLRERLLAGAQQ